MCGCQLRESCKRIYKARKAPPITERLIKQDAADGQERYIWLFIEIVCFFYYLYFTRILNGTEHEKPVKSHVIPIM